MEGDWIAFPELLRWWGAGLLLPLALASLWKFELRPRAVVPLTLLLACLWLHAPILQFAARCETALLDSPPLALLDRVAEALPLS